MIKSPDSFASRHIGPNDEETKQMLSAIGVDSISRLIDETIPSSIRSSSPLNLPTAMTEYEYLEHIKTIAEKNKLYRSYIGLGYYNTITPSVILRNIFENPGWYTQYTPYQAEISQGRLESLLNFQTMILDLTGLEITNASLLDEATAAAEAMHMLFFTRSVELAGNNEFFVSNKCFPQTIDVLQTRAVPHGIKLIIGDDSDIKKHDKLFGVLLQNPDSDGAVHDYTQLIKDVHNKGVKVVIAADILSLVLIKSPGDMNADVAVGSTQRFGVPIGFGGPHAAFFAAKEEFKRAIPGRIIGVSIDARNNTAYRMALQTREQHIKREKATSNICTAQALLANMAAMYAVYHGPAGLKQIAKKVHHLTVTLSDALTSLGYKQLNKIYFDTLKINTENIGAKAAGKILSIADSSHINFRKIDDNHIGISLDETVSANDLGNIAKLFAKTAGKETPVISVKEKEIIAGDLIRHTEILTHPVFNTHHSETQMMRYIKRLESKDLALNTSMIPLGSCTMKLNAASEMIPVSWPAFANLHPFVPKEQAEGYLQIIHELESYMCAITGFDACSLQPNSGAQGEYAGLMVIRAYHSDNGNSQRNVALIPSSAHGTNPASAVMAGMKVAVVKCDEIGNIDLTDLKAKAEQYKNELSCLMVTYPSTHGVFEESIKEICNIIHSYGGLVYMDGANMNAMVGLTNPAEIGADVNHINLHKTFSIPHGGGGPGMGPICVNKKLAAYLPKHVLTETGGSKGIHAISSAPFGSALILIISYGYIRMLGAKGCLEATRYAILNANYLKAILEKHYPILYKGKNGRCAHEFILDLREFKRAGIEAEDVAKRLMDYGFHAPTLSFPVPGTIMIEPTESEDKAELDNFCHALISIREEIAEVEENRADKIDNVLKNAPHTAYEATSDDWQHTYPRSKAVYPAAFVKQNKFWPSVSRVNSTYGDRNLICTCPPVENYEESFA
jgi:glycine dehydrogenase